MNANTVIERQTGQKTHPTLAVPWWRVGVMWVFFVGGLGGVVVASFALLSTAISNRDVVLPHDAPAPRMRAASGSVESVSATSNSPTSSVPNQPNSPAMQARNHAATPPR